MTSLKKRIVAATPMICLIIYLSLGYCIDGVNMWLHGLPVFLLIPIMPVILSENIYKLMYPLFCIIIYICIGASANIWHPTWIIFLTIPVFYIIFGPYLDRKKVEIVED